MDISGVDVDFLSDDEILLLCGNVIDIADEECCSVLDLDDIDAEDLPSNKIDELYDKVLYESTSGNVVHLSDKQILDNNYKIVDTDENEILLNGLNINLDNLSEDEILALYNDVIDIDTGESFLLASYNPYVSSSYADVSCSLTKKSLGSYYNGTWRQLSLDCNNSDFEPVSSTYAVGYDMYGATVYVYRAFSVLATDYTQGQTLEDAFYNLGGCYINYNSDGTNAYVREWSNISTIYNTGYYTKEATFSITCYAFTYGQSVSGYGILYSRVAK